MRSFVAKWMCLTLFVAFSPWLVEAKSTSIDTGECGGDIKAEATVTKSSILSDKNHAIRAYGVLSYRYSREDSVRKKCHVEYRILVSSHSRPFTAVKRIEWDTDVGEIAGIELIGFSPNERQLAADFWLAEGDGTIHRPVVYDAVVEKAMYRPLDDKIQKRIHGCDQNEDFVGVTDSGEAVFAIPPSIYDDSPACGDKGLWHFNLKTGAVKRVAKNSGVSWR